MDSIRQSEIIDGILSQDGAVKRRGGGTYLSTAFGTGGIDGLWAGDLVSTTDVVLAAAEGEDRLWRVDGTPVDLRPVDPQPSTKSVSGQGIVVVRSIAYAGATGSILATPYTTGTASTTIGTFTVTGAGTSWLGTVTPGSFFQFGTGSPQVIQSVESNTSMTLGVPAEATVAGGAYTVWGAIALPYPGQPEAFAGGRVWQTEGDKLRFSDVGTLAFQPDNYHRFGERPVGAHAHRDGLMAFTRGGVYLVSNIQYDLIDAVGNVQQRVDQISQDIVLVASQGLASWRGAVIAPAESGIWLLDSVGQPVNIAEKIGPAWRAQASLGAGFVGQAAVFREHYLLPIFNGIAWETWVCRLDQGFSWVRWTGFGGAVKAWATNPAHATGPKLYAAPATGQRVVDASGILGGSWNADADGTVPELQLTTRGYRLPLFATAYKLRALDQAVEQWDVAAIRGWGEEEPLTPLDEPYLAWRGALDVPWFIRLVFRSSSQTAALYELDLTVREKGRQ
jgi:hypothetical protein